MENEIWRPVPFLPYGDNYEVSNLGSVRRRKATACNNYPAGRRLSPGARRGYPVVRLYRDGGASRTFHVHTLVAWAFLSPPPPGKTLVLHRDDDKSNARSENLRWGTYAENSADMVAKGRQAFGNRHPRAVLTEEQVQQIRRLYASSSHTQEALAAKFGVTQSTISAIVRRRLWSRVSWSSQCTK